jgi:hypothetical protein
MNAAARPSTTALVTLTWCMVVLASSALAVVVV